MLRTYGTAVMAAILCLLPIVTGANASELGVNYNGLTRNYSNSDLQRTGTTWVRAFIDVTRLMRSGGDIASDPDVAGFLQIHDAGYKVILNLKYDYSDGATSDNFPSDTSSQAFIDVRAFTTELLNVVYDKADIIVSGNEPFIESHINNRGNDLFLFYKAITNHVITYNKTRRNIPIYVGAFNNLQQSFMQNSVSAKDLISYAENTPGVTGIDLHMHTTSIQDMDNAITWARVQLGTSKKMISTEFSLKNYFKQHLGDTINAGFASQYGINPAWKVYQYLNYALTTPRPRSEWVAFLQASSWFTTVQTSLADADALFDTKGLTVATYALRQSQASIPSTSTDPWMLNPLYCNQSCVPNPSTGLPQFNYQWIDSFRARQ